MCHQRRDWDEIGQLDTLWAILADPAKRHDRWDLEEFLATGQLEVDAMLEKARRWDLPERRDSALDFGCGVGRLTRALAANFATAAGVDISDVMVRKARTMHGDVPGCRFEVIADGGLKATPDRTFDCIYSRFVLQHIADRRVIEGQIREFVRLLASGGLLVFQLPASIPPRRRLQVRPALYALLRSIRIPESLLYRRFGLHPIRMRSIPEDDVVQLLTASGATILDIDRTEMGTTGIQDRIYWAARSR